MEKLSKGLYRQQESSKHINSRQYDILFFRERERKERGKRGREKGRKEERREGPPLGNVQSTKVDLLK